MYYVAKARRLYDVANVLASIGLIRKLGKDEQKKPTFEWIFPVDISEENRPLISSQENINVQIDLPEIGENEGK